MADHSKILEDQTPAAVEASNQTAIIPAPSFKLAEGDIERRNGTPVCKLDVALRLIKEFKKLFPGSPLSIMTMEWVSREDEKLPFDKAYDLVRMAIARESGIPEENCSFETSFERRKEWTTERRLEWIRLLFGPDSRPNILQEFGEDSEGNGNIENLFAKIDDKSDPFGRLFITTALTDARIDIGSLLRRMSSRIDVRSLFAEIYEGETESMRIAFKRLIDQLLGTIGLEKAKPDFVVIKMDDGPADGLAKK